MTTAQPDSVLRHPPFVLFWFARVAATVGYQMLIVAVGWQLYELTSNPFDLGLIGLIQFIPAILLVLVIGQAADRHDRRMLLVGCQIVEAIAVTALLAAVMAGTTTRNLILGVAFIMGVA